MVMRGRKRKGTRYFGPYAPRLRHPRHARPAAAHLPDPHLLRQQVQPPRSASAGRACCSTSRSAAGPCVGEIDEPTYDALVQELRRLPRRRHRRRSCTGSRPRCSAASDELEFERAARVRDRLAAVRKAIEKQQMVAETQRGHRRHRASPTTSSRPRCRCSSCARGRVVGRKGFVLDKVGGAHRRAGSSTASSRSCTATSRRSACPSRCWCRSSPTTPTPTRSGSPHLRGSQGADPRAPARRQARAAGDGHPQRHGGVHPPPPAPRRRPQHAGPGAHRAAGPARPARGAAAHRVLRHEPPPGHRLRRLDGGAGGRPAEASASTAASRSRACRATTTSPRWRRCSPAASPPTSPTATKPVADRGGPASSPTRRSCCWSTAARASSAWPCGCSRSSACEDEIPVASLAKRFEEVYVPGAERAGASAPRQRGAVPAAAHPRRGPPLRHHLPPRAAGQAHDHARSLDGIPGLGETRKKRLVKELGGVRHGEAGLARGAARR